MPTKTPNATTPTKRRGRPANRQSTKLSSERAVAMVKDKVTPLDVMLENMWFWHDAAKASQQRAEVMMSDLEAAKDDHDFEKFGELLEGAKKVFDAHINHRQESQHCAVDCAPYVHARFQSIMFKNESEQATVIRATLPPTAAQQAKERSYRENYEDESNLVPLKRTA